METAITFKQACELLKDRDKSLIDAVDRLYGLVIVLSPVVLGPPALPALALLGVKQELLNTLRAVMKKVNKRTTDPIDREDRIATSFCLTCYAAFFEQLGELLPTIQTSLKVGRTQALDFTTATRPNQADDLQRQNPTGHNLDDFSLTLPHPASAFAETLAQLHPLYVALANGYMYRLRQTEAWANAPEDARRSVQKSVYAIPANAVKRFEALYLDLAINYQEFLIWSTLKEHAAARKQAADLSSAVAAHLTLTNRHNRRLDIGLVQLGAAISTLPARTREHQASEVLEELAKVYSARIQEPIIERREELGDGDDPILTYPKKTSIFVPQAFEMLRYTRKLSLERPQTWAGLTRQETVGAFLLSFFTSPYSQEAPLLVLGQPGSGKSLLTQILAARLLAPAFTPIRVEMRDSDPEDEIQGQLETAIGKETGRHVNWADLGSYFTTHPPILIFDGYDELLQASGKVFASFLVKVRDFQRREYRLGRPMRAMVTSRVTLIDKAIIPDGTTVLRLAPFDGARRKRWLGIWNRTNASFFAATDTKPFVLPDDPNISPLAEQPLLLLMLALYDSVGNALANIQGLDRTRLYSSLIERFIEREKEKDSGGEVWAALSGAERAQEILLEVERLGAAALGMFNRRELHILSGDLNEDLRFLNLERRNVNGSGARLSQADLLLGSFFFVQESRSGLAGSRDERPERGSAFEFLHNTFGEFLTADFILRTVINEAQAVSALGRDVNLQYQLLQKLESPDGLPAAWYTALMYTPLFSRPVILRMITEWFPHKIGAKDGGVREVLAGLDVVIKNELRRLLGTNSYPSIMLKDVPGPCGARPLVGYAAVYSLNLVLLRAALDRELTFTFDETSLKSFEENIRPWDRLSYLWRSWFGLEGLKGLAALVKADRIGEVVGVRMRTDSDMDTTATASDRLLSVVQVGEALGDRLLVGLAGLAWHDPGNPKGISLDSVNDCLDAENLGLQLRIAWERVRYPSGHWGSDERRERLKAAVGVALLDGTRWPSLAENILAMAREELSPRSLEEAIVSLSEREELRIRMSHPLEYRERVLLHDSLAVDAFDRSFYAPIETRHLRATRLLLDSSLRERVLPIRLGDDEADLRRLTRLSEENPREFLLTLSRAPRRSGAREADDVLRKACASVDGESVVRGSPQVLAEYLSAGKVPILVADWVIAAFRKLSESWWIDIPVELSMQLLLWLGASGGSDVVEAMGRTVIGAGATESQRWSDVGATMRLVRLARLVDFANPILTILRRSAYEFGKSMTTHGLTNPVWDLVGRLMSGPLDMESERTMFETMPVGYVDDLRWLFRAATGTTNSTPLDDVILSIIS